MKISLKFKDTDEKRVLNAFDCAYGGRVSPAKKGEELKEGEVSHTKTEWVKLQVAKFVRQTVEGYEASKARQAAEAEVVDKLKKLEVE